MKTGIFIVALIFASALSSTPVLGGTAESSGTTVLKNTSPPKLWYIPSPVITDTFRALFGEHATSYAPAPPHRVQPTYYHVPGGPFLTLRKMVLLSEGFSLALKLDKSVLTPEQDAKVTVVPHNPTDNALLAWTMGGRAEIDYDILLTDATGKEAPLSTLGYNWRSENGVRHPRTDSIKPGGDYPETFALSEFYDILAPGKYTLTVSRAYAKDGNPTGSKLGQIWASTPVEVVASPNHTGADDAPPPKRGHSLAIGKVESRLPVPLTLEEADAFSVNDRGQVVGHSTTNNGAQRAILWNNGKLVELGTLPGCQYSDAQAINDSGQVAGDSMKSGGSPHHAVLWSKGNITDLGTLPDGKHSRALGINSSGEAVGYSDRAEGRHEHSVLWSKGEVIDLGVLPGFTSSIARAINDSGQVVGDSSTIGFQHAFLWSKGKMTDLGPLQRGQVSSANGINNSGQVAGLSTIAGGSQHAVLWKNGEMVDLGTLPGGKDSYASGINEAGQVVGFSTLADSSYHAVLWSEGKIIDLGTLPGGGPSAANGINNKGQIVGFSKTADGSDHAVLWTNGKITDLGALPRRKQTRR